MFGNYQTVETMEVMTETLRKTVQPGSVEGGTYCISEK